MLFKKRSTLAIIIIGIALFALYVINDNTIVRISIANETSKVEFITLVDYKVAYIEESGEILLLSRDETKPEYVLSDSLSIAILLLKQKALAGDYKDIIN